jgi:hypothetical protein
MFIFVRVCFGTNSQSINEMHAFLSSGSRNRELTFSFSSVRYSTQVLLVYNIDCPKVLEPVTCMPDADILKEPRYDIP